MRDEKHVEEIYYTYKDKIQGYIATHINNPSDVEDLTSEVFLKINEKIKSYDETKSSVSTWVYTITRNTVIDYYRRNKITHELYDEIEDQSDSYLDNLCREETLTDLVEALSILDERLRDVIIFRFDKGMSLKDIARTMDMSYANVKILQKKAFAQLRSELEKKGVEI